MDKKSQSQSYGPVVPRSSAVFGRAEAGVPIGPYLMEMLDPFQSDTPPVPDGVMNGVVKKLTWTKSLTGQNDYVFLLYPNRLGENIFVGKRVLDPILGKPGIGLKPSEDPSDIIDAQYDMGAVISAGFKARAASAPIGNTALNGTIVAGSIPSTVMPAAFDPDSVIALDPQTDVRNTPAAEGVVLRGSCNGIPLYEKPHYLTTTAAFDSRDLNLDLDLTSLLLAPGTTAGPGVTIASTISPGDPSADSKFPGHLGRLRIDASIQCTVPAAFVPASLSCFVTTLDENGVEQTIGSGALVPAYIHGVQVVNSIYTFRGLISVFAKRPVYRIYVSNTSGTPITLAGGSKILCLLYGTFFREVPLKIAHIANIDVLQQVTFEATIVTYLKPSTALAKELMMRVKPVAHEFQAFVSACEIAHTFPSVFTLAGYNQFCSSFASYPNMTKLTDANYISGRASWITDIGDYARKAVRRFGPKVIDYGADWLKGQLSGTASEMPNMRRIHNFVRPGESYTVRADKDTFSTYQGDGALKAYITSPVPFTSPVTCKLLRSWSNRSIYWYDRDEMSMLLGRSDAMPVVISFEGKAEEISCTFVRRKQVKRQNQPIAVPAVVLDTMDLSDGSISGRAAPLMCVPFDSLTDTQRAIVYVPTLLPSTNYFRGVAYCVFDPDKASQAQKDVLVDAVPYPPPAVLARAIFGRASEQKAQVPDLGADDFKVPADDGMGTEQEDPLAEPERPPESHVEPTGMMVASEASILSLIGASKAQIGLDAHGGIFGGGSSSTAFFPIVYDQDGAQRCKMVLLTITQEPLTLVNGGRLAYTQLEGNEDSLNRAYVNNSFAKDESGNNVPAIPVGGAEDVAVYDAMKRMLGGTTHQQIYINLLQTSEKGLLANVALTETSFYLALCMALTGAKGLVVATGVFESLGRIAGVGDWSLKFSTMAKMWNSQRGKEGIFLAPSANYSSNELDADANTIRQLLAQSPRAPGQVLFVSSVAEAVACGLAQSPGGAAANKAATRVVANTPREAVALIQKSMEKVKAIDMVYWGTMNQQFKIIIDRKATVANKLRVLNNFLNALELYLNRQASKARHEETLAEHKETTQKSLPQAAALAKQIAEDEDLRSDYESRAEATNTAPRFSVVVAKLEKGESLNTAELSYLQHLQRSGVKTAPKKKGKNKTGAKAQRAARNASAAVLGLFSD